MNNLNNLENKEDEIEIVNPDCPLFKKIQNWNLIASVEEVEEKIEFLKNLKNKGKLEKFLPEILQKEIEREINMMETKLLLGELPEILDENILHKRCPYYLVECPGGEEQVENCLGNSLIKSILFRKKILFDGIRVKCDLITYCSELLKENIRDIKEILQIDEILFQKIKSLQKDEQKLNFPIDTLLYCIYSLSHLILILQGTVKEILNLKENNDKRI
jgi:hypothetical protein